MQSLVNTEFVDTFSVKPDMLNTIPPNILTRFNLNRAMLMTTYFLYLTALRFILPVNPTITTADFNQDEDVPARTFNVSLSSSVPQLRHELVDVSCPPQRDLGH